METFSLLSDSEKNQQHELNQELENLKNKITVCVTFFTFVFQSTYD